MRSHTRATFPVRLPPDLEHFLNVVGSRRVGAFVPLRTTRTEDFTSLVVHARRSAKGRAKLLVWLAGGIPFGTTRDGALFVYMVGEPSSPARGTVALLDFDAHAKPEHVCKGAAAFAMACALDESLMHGVVTPHVDELRKHLPPPGVAEQESVRGSFERASSVLALLCGEEEARRSAATKLFPRPLDVPSPQPIHARTHRKKNEERTSALALGSLVEAFFRYDGEDFVSTAAMHRESGDLLVRDACRVLVGAVERPTRSKLSADLATRRDDARKHKVVPPDVPSTTASKLTLTRRIIAEIDAARAEPSMSARTERREQGLFALSELGDADILPVLTARAAKSDAVDVDAVDMLAALGHTDAVPHLLGLLGSERADHPDARAFEASIVRALGNLRVPHVGHALRTLLAARPMTNWREGIARAAVVSELVEALGNLRDEQAGPNLLAVLEGQSQEYRAMAKTAAWALGRIHYLPALDAIERMLSSPKTAVTCESIWAVGELGRAHPETRERIAALLENLHGLEPGSDVVRHTALAKVRPSILDGANLERLRDAFSRALWEPAFRREETAHRRVWALRSFKDLAPPSTPGDPRSLDVLARVIDHDAIRYFVTQSDHRVRREAEEAFAAWDLPIPKTRRYYAFLLDDLEREGGLDALHDALRDPLGVFRHNVATYLSRKGDLASVRPLAEATARLFAEPPTSTYEYDDAPNHLVAFVQALAHLNQPEGNAVLIEGLRTGHHHVRAVVAENAPDDERFIPELMAMLGDTRSFLRSRAERSLHALGVRRSASDVPPLIAET